jgi:tRNA U34 2-thiouridine synthase MnmA/TrmU
LHFISPFFGGDDSVAKAAEHLGIELGMIPVGKEYMQVLREPVYGYGKFYNPCIDCHAFMIRKAGALMEEYGASFISSGEVLGQRPMSQTKSALQRVDKLSGLGRLTLRPLSAKLLPPTLPELEGWVDRERLFNIQGRGRHIQMEYAAAWGIEEYPSPAGGCLLTMESPAKRLKDYFAFSQDTAALDDLNIIRNGRHIYLDGSTLLVIGRNQNENKVLQINNTLTDILLRVTNYPGPTGLLRTHPPAEEISAIVLEQAAALVARYSDAKEEPLAEVRIYNNALDKILKVKPAPLLPQGK